MIHLYDTAKNSLQAFSPDHKVQMYICGITPYDSAHLGHVFTFMAYDLLQRRLESLGHEVQLVRNVTDVDEPIFKRAKDNGEHYMELAKRETAAFQKVMAKLNFREPFAQPLASEYIQQMIVSVKKLLDNDQAYTLENGDVYFDTTTYADFGAPSNFSHNLQTKLMADRGGDPSRADKRNPLDFLLWKAVADPQDPASWNSPMGLGRPGWHIECTVMSGELLDTPFDLHGGSMDLIFPHHACEIAQSVALTGKPSAKHWMHVAPLLYHGEKMSKSLGNLVFAQDVLHSASPAALRLALMNYHYRTGGEWRDDVLAQALTFEKTLRSALAQSAGPDPGPYVAKTLAAIDNDLDTHTALHALESFAAAILVGTGTDSEAPKQLKTLLGTLGIVLD